MKATIIKGSEVNAVPCPCGMARRILRPDLHGGPCGIHRVSITAEAKKHFHKKTTECYVILSGKGQIDLDDATHDVAPDDVIFIPPMTRHALRGQFEIINIVLPFFDSADEFVVE